MAGRQMKLPSEIPALEETCFNGCDLCGSRDSTEVAKASSRRWRIVVCSNCALLYASPQPPLDSWDGFYEDVFEGDPGSKKRIGTGLPQDIQDQEKDAVTWALPMVTKFIDVSSKRILDVRCQSGALSGLLAAAGAEVSCIDPFQANINYCAGVRGLPNARVVPFHRFGDTAKARGPFDAVTVLSDHTLAHVSSPRRFLTEIRDALIPGGFLFLAEKDVLRPSWAPGYNIQFVLDSGRSHQYHLTLHTIERYLQVVGYEIIQCRYDERVTAYHFVSVVARKRVAGVGAAQSTPIVYSGPSAREIRQRLAWLNFSHHIRRSRLQISLKTRVTLGRVPGLRAAWQFMHRTLVH